MIKSSKRKPVNTDHHELLNGLRSLARNLWWSWNPIAQRIFRTLSPTTWEAVNHNPVALLANFSDEELLARLGDPGLRKELREVLSSFNHYMEKERIWKGPKTGKRGTVAYFCAEFGIHECLPMYSGGLGVLAGDHAKSASDLGLPFVGVGLFYRQGYFQQQIDLNGCQRESYPHTDPALIPVQLVKDIGGKPVVRSVEIGSSVVYFQAWRINVGTSQIYLLDTDVPINEDYARGLTALAYGGDATTRIRQEIILGIGGVRFLRAIGVKPAVYHINEGHAAFLTFELIRDQLKSGLSLAKATEKVKQKCIFTTHTPVPAGHDSFPKDLFEITMHPYADALNISVDKLMDYGKIPDQPDQSTFTMTILALKLSRAANGVSRKHADVSRKMWMHLYKVNDPRKVPIGSVTNGIHVPSWTMCPSWEFWERHDSHRWKEDLMDQRYWNHITDPKAISDEELWSLRYSLRRDMIEFIRTRMKDQHSRMGIASDESYRNLLSPDALTIGYARRFAPYKRATMIFRDMKKIETIFNTPNRPLQIIFAGKAHPHDEEGKQFLQHIVAMTRHPHFFGKVIFIENYDMNVARHLISGCDVWLNTPRKPLEASGTSGQKIAINGGLHASILDGWWDEAYDGKNGWAIESMRGIPSSEIQDDHDAQALYRLLQQDILPLFYERDQQGIPRKWIAKIRRAMRTIIPVYNTHRMVAEYAAKYYFPVEK
ncbi:MAG: alpha-glucan family phosphorylase [Bacteroidota bacterium]